MFSYFFIRLFTFPLGFLSQKKIVFLGRILGRIFYHLLSNFRKRTLSNLSLAKDLKLSNTETIEIAKKSFENLVIVCLEYAKLYKEKDISKLAKCLNPEKAANIINSGKSVIFLTGHQANWEIPLLEASRRFKGVAIGKPTKNKLLYNWILKIREKYGGKVVEPKEAVKESLKMLKKENGSVGIVGDQGMPNSGFSSMFLGREAYSSTLPALLAYKTKSPIIVITIVRTKNSFYELTYSDPIWPTEAPLEQEIPRLTKESLKILEESIKKNPSDWLWQHNRWKSPHPKRIKRKFNHDSISVILSKNNFKNSVDLLKTLSEFYSKSSLNILTPQEFEAPPCNELIFYNSKDDLLKISYKYKLVFNFTDNRKLTKHFLKHSAIKVISLKDLANKNLEHLIVRSNAG